MKSLCHYDSYYDLESENNDVNSYTGAPGMTAVIIRKSLIPAERVDSVSEIINREFLSAQ